MESAVVHIPGPNHDIEKACRIVAETIMMVGRRIKPGISTIELDNIAEDNILSSNGKPAFKGYVVGNLEFKHSLCISVNEEVVHGVPGARILQEGDIVSIDCGVEYNGWFGDSAYTFPVGTIDKSVQDLLDVTKESLNLGVRQAKARTRSMI